MIPAGRLPPQPWLEAAETRAVVAALSAEGAEVRFVGGCVRDAVLGRPVRDVDIATHDPPDRVMALLGRAGIRAVPTGIDHGTVTAVLGGEHFEITTLRLDVETDGRRARIAYTDDWRADAARRDLTINALYCDPQGRIYDAFGGLADLRMRRVRFVGEARQRIGEDVLRLLRFFRFLAHYGRLPPDADGLAACREFAPRLPALSGERVSGELLRLLAAPDPGPVVALMAEEGILAHLLPQADGIARLRALVTVEGLGAGADPLRRLAALVTRQPEAVAERLRLSNAERERLAALVLPPVRLEAEPGQHALRVLLYRLGAERVRDLALLAWAERVAAQGDVDPREGEVWQSLLACVAAWTPVLFPLRGRDLLALGIPPGPALGRLLSEAEAWWIEKDLRPGRDELLEWARPHLSAEAGREGGDSPS